jgi:Tetratricopeptide repeat
LTRLAALLTGNPITGSKGDYEDVVGRLRHSRDAAGPIPSDGQNEQVVATDLNNFAGLLQAQGDFAEARPLYERALAIREKVLGPEHPDTATSLNNLALLHQAPGDVAALG